MEEIVLKYIIKNFQIRENKTLENINTKQLTYGEEITNELMLIFAIDSSFTYDILSKWILEQVKDNVIENFWLKKSNIEPNYSNRFIVEFPDEFEIPSYIVKSVSRPNLVSTETELSFKFGSYKIPNPIRWEPVEIEFHDTNLFSVNRKLTNIMLGNYVSREVHRWPLIITTISSTGERIEQWNLIGFIREIKTDMLDYSSNELLKTKIFFEVDTCNISF